ncbi:MAG: hypothetical protein J7L55_02565 [Desulfurococcales archaeon]|nr:hypothetical protein [Desulfurococcales archaeon]
MVLITKVNAYRAAVVLTGKKIRSGYFLNILLKGAARRGTRNIVLTVFSPLGSPHYLEVLRDVIQNNIANALNIEFGGDTPEDLERFLSNEDEVDLFLDDPSTPFAEKARGLGRDFTLIPYEEVVTHE